MFSRLQHQVSRTEKTQFRPLVEISPIAPLSDLVQETAQHRIALRQRQIVEKRKLSLMSLIKSAMQ